MRDMDTGRVSEPACLIGLDESTSGMRHAKTIGKQQTLAHGHRSFVQTFNEGQTSPIGPDSDPEP